MTATTLLVAGARSDLAAHPQASPDRNNRYVKVTPMGDRIRLAYTVYLGEAPGARARARLDRDRDGQIDDREAGVLGDEVGALVRPAVDLALDGAPAAIDWATLDVGLGTPATRAGALAVDLVGWACTGPGADHSLTLRDRVRIDEPGEIEVRIEESPGVTLGARTLGGEPMRDLVATWRGDEGRLATGLVLAYTVDASRAVQPQDQRCRATGGARGGHGHRALVVGSVAAALAALAAALVWRRRRRASSDAPPRT